MAPRELHKHILKEVSKKTTKSIKKRFDGMDIELFISPNVIYLHGSNELKDWKINLSGIFALPNGHPGYRAHAKLLHHVIEKELFEFPRPFYLLGHSYGGAVIHEYMRRYGRKNKMLIHASTSGAPCSSPFMTLRKIKNLTMFIKKDDPVRFSWIFFFCRWPRAKKVALPKTNYKGIKDHLKEAYIEVL